MTYIGQQPATTFDSGIQDRFTGLSSNTVTLTHEISAEEDILVVWNNIVQDKNTYSVGGTGNKTLTLGGTLVSADVVTVYYLNKVMQSVNPTAGSVGLEQLSATGTASSSNFLRGDNSWQTPTGFDVTSITGATELAENPAKTDEMVISDAGTLKRVDLTHIYPTPIVHVRMDTTPDTQSSVDIKLNLDTEVIDSDGKFDTSTNRFTPTIAGYYVIFGMVEFVNVNHTCNVQIRKNGTADSSNIGRGILGKPNMSTDEISPSIMSIIYLDSDDYVEIWCGQDSGSTRMIRYGRMLAFKLNHGGTAS